MKYILLILLSYNFGLLNNHCSPNYKNKKMLNYDQCLKIAQDKLNEATGNDKNYIIWEIKTITKNYGWIFTPATKTYIDTGDMMSLVPGISPIIVNKYNSDCIMMPSSISPEDYILEYEKKLKGNQKK